jgi:hypothetical protein
MFAAALIAAYPNVKAVLVQQPFKACYRSFWVVTDG